MLKYHLPYQQNSVALFERMRHLPWAVWLDSGKPVSEYGRYDIMVAAPFIKLTTMGKVTQIERADSINISTEDPFLLLKNLLSDYDEETRGSPFTGGALGYFGYDLARRLEVLPTTSQPSLAIPEMMIGIYDWAVIVDHQLQTCSLVSSLKHADTQSQWQTLCDLFIAPHTSKNISFRIENDIKSNLSKADYSKAFNTIKHFITEGDCYQVNLAQRFSAKATGDAWLAYKKLRDLSPAPFMSFMQYPNFQVLSGSPERFIQVKNNHIETRPIKGTRPRSNNPINDAENAKELQASVKDRAENLMIVDLLRNDIGKNCEIGTVVAKDLFKLQSFANVHHLVSIVTGKLAIGKTALDVLRGCFPGGSITGAPKLRAMQIIEALEPHRRNIYCGSIGYIGFDGQSDTNIAIRTAVYSQNTVEFQAGGGIVADSELNNEYAETLDKASSLMKTMQYFQGGD